MSYTSGNINSDSIIVQAMLNIMQSTNQAVINKQSLEINCNKSKDYCNKCIETAKKYKLGNGDYSEVCFSCICNAENINMNSIISVDLEAFSQANIQNNINQQIKNSITQQATYKQTPLSSGGDKLESLVKSTTNITNNVQESIKQGVLQELRNFQVLTINNPNTNVINVDMDLSVKFLSKVVQSTENYTQESAQVNNNISQVLQQQSTDIITSILSTVITLLLVFFMVYMFSFIFGMIQSDLTLYASI